MAVHDLAQTIAGRVAVADAEAAKHDKTTQLAARPSSDETQAR